METMTLTKNSEHSSWALRNDSFTGDELIEAYLKGCDEGVAHLKRILLKKLKQNIAFTQELGSEFIGQLNSNEVICKSAHMKYLDIERYKIIFVLDKDIYYDFEKMYPFYRKAEEFEKSHSNDDFGIEISFIPDADSLNSHRLMSDGYIFHYNG